MGLYLGRVWKHLPTIEAHFKHGFNFSSSVELLKLNFKTLLF